ncbi:MAG: hypothetical protein K9N35_08280 [Candidatus Marinimicrobia bacterium]|nr:hypothetical protein [Candidatus Neomarinimicrobiota bacterium]
MRYTSLNNNQVSTIFRGPRGRARVILGSVPAEIRQQTPAFALPEPVLPKEEPIHYTAVPITQLIGQSIHESAIPESPSVF